MVRGILKHMVWLRSQRPQPSCPLFLLTLLRRPFRLVSRQNPVDSPFVQIMRASHVIKGAASNLMCKQLRLCAMNLETAASSASNDPSSAGNPAVLQQIQARYEELKVAVQNYHAYLQTVGV